MSTITTINDSDVVGDSNETINTNFSNLNADKMEKSNNLSDLTNDSIARTNLGLGNSATKDVGTGSGQVAAGDHTHDDRYFTEAEVTSALAGKSDTSHNHDSRYYTEAESDVQFAPVAKGVTNGDSHDHSGGDGAQIAHSSLSGIGTNTHAQIDSHVAASSAHGVSGSVVGTADTQTLTNKTIGTSNLISINAPRGFLINGKLSITVASNNITVAIKGVDGNDPSATNPVYCRIGDTVRSITAALSVTKNAGTNWFNAGSAELATKEIDYFAYLGYNATDGVVIGFARVVGYRYGDFNTTSTNEKYCAISTITTAASTDYYELIGRFAATLSATASFNWSVPTYTAVNLIQRPIFETRVLSWAPTITGFSANPTDATYKYKLLGSRVFIDIREATAGTSNGTGFTYTLPFSSIDFGFTQTTAAAQAQNNGSILTAPAMMQMGNASTNVLNIYTGWGGAAWTASSTKRVLNGQLSYEI